MGRDICIAGEVCLSDYRAKPNNVLPGQELFSSQQIAAYEASGRAPPPDLALKLETVVKRFSHLDDPQLLESLEEELKKESKAKIAEMKAKGLPIPEHLANLVSTFDE